MGCRITDLRCKEVINIHSGVRLGFVSDVEVDVTCGKVVAIIVPGGGLSLLGIGEDFIVPWECICKIGDDIILVEHELPPRPRRDKRRWF